MEGEGEREMRVRLGKVAGREVGRGGELSLLSPPSWPGEGVCFSTREAKRGSWEGLRSRAAGTVTGGSLSGLSCSRARRGGPHADLQSRGWEEGAHHGSDGTNMDMAFTRKQSLRGSGPVLGLPLNQCVLTQSPPVLLCVLPVIGEEAAGTRR